MSGSASGDVDVMHVFRVVRDHMSPGMALGAKFAGSGAVEVEALGATVRLSDGREVLDFGSYAVTLLGHRHPRVVAAVRSQLDAMPTSTRVLANPTVARFVEALVASCGGRFPRVWLGSDGADAVEAACKSARAATGKYRILAVEGSFHGKTLGALAATSAPRFRRGLEPLLAGVTHVERSDAGAVAREVASGDVAALLFEPIQGEGGVVPLDFDVVRRWIDDAHAAGALVIADEIQVGTRRCGPMSLSVDRGLPVDAVLLGKALGGGVLPLSALLATEELFEPLSQDHTWHTSTFSGHPLSCAAALAALAVLDEVAPCAASLASHIESTLHAIQDEHPEVVREVRGCGLLWGIELASPAMSGEVLIDLAERGLLVSPCLGRPEVIRLLPPAIAEKEQVDCALNLLSVSLGVADRGVASH